MLLTVLLGIASLAVDAARVQVARTQLSHAAEAAARAGAAMLDSGGNAVRATARDIASLNLCDGKPVTLADGDIEPGIWDAERRQFTPLASNQQTSSANAVRVRAKRTKEVGGQIPLTFASIFGIDGCNAYGSAVAKLTRSLPEQGLIGLDEVRFSSLGVLAEIRGNVASNGNIYIGTPLGLLVGVTGNVQSYRGTVSKGVLAGISGSQAALQQPLDCPSVQLPTRNDNDRIAAYLDSQGDFNAVLAATIPAGTYVVRNLNLLAGVAIRLEGPVTFYVTGNVNIAVGVNLLGDPWFPPSNFKIRVAPGGRVNFLANLLTPVCLDLYAPDAQILIAVTVANFRGRIVGKTVQMGIPALSRFDVRDAPSDPPTITLVE